MHTLLTRYPKKKLYSPQCPGLGRKTQGISWEMEFTTCSILASTLTCLAGDERSDMEQEHQSDE